MKTEDIPDKLPEPWIPEKNTLNIALLGKLAEEASELAGICSRSIIQGIEGKNPETGISNIVALENEIGDVLAKINLAIPYLNLDLGHIQNRRALKQQFSGRWFSALNDAEGQQ